MNATTWVRIGALLGGLGVIAGAFGAHLLKNHLDEPAMVVFETGARYEMYHALALLAVGLLGMLGRGGTSMNVAGWSFLIGILLFSGSLYALALTGNRRLGIITPIGGLALIVGWFALAVEAGLAAKATGAEL